MASTVNVMSLCSGIGGLDLGVRLAIPSARTVVYVEREAYCAEVLLSRMEEGRLDSAPVWTDLKTFNGSTFHGLVDLIVGGYPCQPFSVAGKRLGENDPRHLWPFIREIVDAVRPGACFFENVPGHVSCGLEQVRADLHAMGYAVTAGLFRAEEVGAPHRRERLFILAHAVGRELWNEPRGGGAGRVGKDRPSLETLVRTWATPTAKGNGNIAGSSETSGDGLETQAKRFASHPDLMTGPPGRSGWVLNPQFVEVLMGLPIGWTDLEP